MVTAVAPVDAAAMLPPLSVKPPFKFTVPPAAATAPLGRARTLRPPPIPSPPITVRSRESDTRIFHDDAATHRPHGR